MKKTLSLFVFSMLLTASLALAQISSTPTRGNGIQHRISFLTTLLSLTTAQQQQATTIFTTGATAAASVHSSMQSARQSLDSAITGNDSAGIEQASTTIGTLTTQLTSIQAKAEAAFYQILTPDQQAKLTQFKSQSRGRFGGGMGSAGFRGNR